MDPALKVRDRLEEFAALRKAAREQNKWLGQGADTTASAECVPQRDPAWIRSLEQFGELERIAHTRVQSLAEGQLAFLQPRFRSDDEELRQLERITAQTAEAQQLLRELERMVVSGMLPRDPTNEEEVWIAANARKHLSARLARLMRMFKKGQEFYGSQLRQRQKKQQRYTYFGKEESHQRMEQESKAAGFMGQGYTEGDIQELLLEEANNEKVSKEIKEILDSVQELHGMFEDLHTLVVEQGTMLDRIDYNIQQSEVGVGRGLQELKKAEEHQDNGCSIM